MRNEFVKGMSIGIINRIVLKDGCDWNLDYSGVKRE